MKNNVFYFVVGSQFLYGEETLVLIDRDSKAMVEGLNADKNIPCTIKWFPCVKTSEEIYNIMNEANNDDSCAGVITWMHTFSPSKMWVKGLTALRKPYLHLNTQFNREIPWNEIDMDFMNLNQSAHGDREHGYIAARLRMNRKVIAGYWQDEEFTREIGVWMRAAVGAKESRQLKVLRISDNMRNVAVTEGAIRLKLSSSSAGRLTTTAWAISSARLRLLPMPKSTRRWQNTIKTILWTRTTLNPSVIRREKRSP